MAASPRKSAAVVIVFGMCIMLSFCIYLVGFNWYDQVKLANNEKQWQGFGPERGNYSFSVVTGLFDIGRGRWWKGTRTYNDYLGYMLQILMMDVNLIVFIEEEGQSFVKRIREGRSARTKIYTVDLIDLEYFPLELQFKTIMNSPGYKEGNVNFADGKCEALDSLYNMVTNSKITLMHRAVLHNPFKSNYFIWLDAGYGHGDKSIYPPDGVWNPSQLWNYPDKVTYVAIRDVPKGVTSVDSLYKGEDAYIAGGLFAGGPAVMEAFYELHKKVMTSLLQRGIVDDDQTSFLECYFWKPELFRPVKGSWYDLMKPFQ